MDCMAIGGLFALMKFYQQKIETAYSGIVHPIRSKWFGLILAIIFLAFLYISELYNVSLYQAYAFLFGLMIIRLIQHPNAFLASGTMNYLGTISYGIYLLHHFWVYAVFGAWPNLGTNLHHYVLGELFYYVLISALTILSAMVSYHFFERRFLKMKN
jgi:peptidoglycan/LPS O-acetylase OafA/YrhL